MHNMWMMFDAKFTRKTQMIGKPLWRFCEDDSVSSFLTNAWKCVSINGGLIVTPEVGIFLQEQKSEATWFMQSHCIYEVSHSLANNSTEVTRSLPNWATSQRDDHT